MAVWKRAAILYLLAGTSGWTDGSLTTTRPPNHSEPPAEEDPNQDFLALSDVANATHNFRVHRSELMCAGGDCGGDVLKVVSRLAKRLLSDPRILPRYAAPSTKQRTGRASRINSRPFIRSRYYTETPSSEDRHRIADLLLTATSDSDLTRSYRKDSYTTQDSADNNLIESNAVSSASFNDYFADYFDDSINDINGPFKNNELSRDTYAGGQSESYAGNDRDSYSTGDSYSGGDSYSAGDSYSGGHNEGGYSGGHGGGSYGGGHSGGSYGGGSYGGGSYGGGSYGGGYGGQCCKDKYLPILLVGSLGLLAFYLFLRSTTTTAAGGGRRRRFTDDDDISDGIRIGLEFH